MILEQLGDVVRHDTTITKTVTTVVLILKMLLCGHRCMFIEYFKPLSQSESWTGTICFIMSFNFSVWFLLKTSVSYYCSSVEQISITLHSSSILLDKVLRIRQLNVLNLFSLSMLLNRSVTLQEQYHSAHAAGDGRSDKRVEPGGPA